MVWGYDGVTVEFDNGWSTMIPHHGDLTRPCNRLGQSAESDEGA
jgi:hypothetical protein